MRRAGVLPLAVMLVLSLWPTSTAAQNEEAEIYSSQDDIISLVTLEVPAGAAAPGATISILSRDPDERPEELAGLPMENPFYELRPVDARFSAPVTVNRLIAFQQLGFVDFDPTVHGFPVVSMFSRDADGVWSWLDDSTVQVQPGSPPAFRLTGSTDHGGPFFGFFGASLIVAPEDPPQSAVGEIFQVEGQLHGPQDMAADIAGASGRSSNVSIARASRTYDVEIFERAAGIEFECLAPGTVTYQVTFAITEVAVNGPFQQLIDIGGVDVDVVYVGVHTCIG